MYMISQKQNEHPSGPILEQAVKISLGNKMGATLVHREILNNRTVSVVYMGILQLPRLSMTIKTIWNITIRNEGITAKIHGDNTTEGVAAYLANFLKGHIEEVYQFLHMVKLLRIAEKQGSLTFDEQSGNIVLKMYIPKIIFISKHKLSLYLLAKIRRSSQIFADNVEELMFNYSLTGVNLLGLEIGSHGQENLRLKQQLEAVWGLRRWYEYIRKSKSQRAYATCANLAQQSQQARKALEFLFNDQPKYIQQEPSPFKHAQILFRGEEKQIEMEISRQREKVEPIVSPIFITSTSHQTLLSQGGYCAVYQGAYRFIFEDSVFQYDRQKESSQQQCEQKTMKKTLVRKSARNGGGASLLTEARLLIYLRNKSCSEIAKYYCNRCPKPFADGNIYIDHYQNTLSEKWMRQPAKVRVLGHIAKALLFLTKEDIVHRDLKEANVMIDRQGHGRLIDFGSAACIGQNSNFKPADNKVRTTEGYFIPYSVFERQLPSIARYFNLEEYYSHPTFDAYAFGVILEHEFLLGSFSGEGDPIRATLRWLSETCRALNPQDRLNWMQVIILLRHLSLLEQEKQRYWRRRIARYF